MQKTFWFGTLAAAAIWFLLVSLRDKNDQVSRLHRDITESMERTQALKVQRDEFLRRVELQRIERIRSVNTTQTFVDSCGTEIPFVQPSPCAVPTSIQRFVNIAPTGKCASIPEGRIFATASICGLDPGGEQTVFRSWDPVYVYAGIHATEIEQIRFEWTDRNGKCIEPARYINVLPNTGDTGYRVYQFRHFDEEGRYGARMFNGAGKMIGETKFSVRNIIQAEHQARVAALAGLD